MKIKIASEKDIPGIAKVHVNSWRTTYQGIVDPNFLQNLSLAEQEEKWKRIIGETPPLIALNQAGEVIGFASAGAERSGDYPDYDAELYAIYILEEYQGQGLGRRLISHTIDSLIDRGFNSMLVIVLAENKARFFYEALGGKRLAEGSLQIGSRNHPELIYGWESLRDLKENMKQDGKEN